MTKRNLIGLAVLCSVLMGVAACGKKSKDKAASGGAAAKLVGTWQFDGKKTVEANAMFKKAKPEHKEKFATMFGKATIEITKDTMVVTGLGPKVQTDKYKVTKTDGKVITISSTDEKGKTETMTITMLSDSEFKAEKQEKRGKMVFFAKRK